MWSWTALQERRCRRNAASSRGALLRQSSSDCCWWDGFGRCGRRTQPCPSVSWSMTSHCSVLATTLCCLRAREHVHGGQAHASRVRDSHQEVQGSQQLSLRAGEAADATGAARRAGNAGRAKSQNRHRVREAASAAGEVQRVCGKRIRKIHRQVVGAVVAMAGADGVSKANHYGVAVTGLNETQLQESRSQVASCLARRMHDKSATMVLMMSGNELDPVFDSLAPVIALTHALWDGWMPLATMAKCVKTAQLEQRDSTRPWTALKGSVQLWRL